LGVLSQAALSRDFIPIPKRHLLDTDRSSDFTHIQPNGNYNCLRNRRFDSVPCRPAKLPETVAVAKLSDRIPTDLQQDSRVRITTVRNRFAFRLYQIRTKPVLFPTNLKDFQMSSMCPLDRPAIFHMARSRWAEGTSEENPSAMSYSISGGARQAKTSYWTGAIRLASFSLSSWRRSNHKKERPFPLLLRSDYLMLVWAHVID
jgi:hypothetical protein